MESEIKIRVPKLFIFWFRRNAGSDNEVTIHVCGSLKEIFAW